MSDMSFPNVVPLGVTTLGFDTKPLWGRLKAIRKWLICWRFL